MHTQTKNLLNEVKSIEDDEKSANYILQTEIGRIKVLYLNDRFNNI